MSLQLESIVNSLEDAVLGVDEDGQVVFLNAAAAKLFDCERHKVVGQPTALCPKLEGFLGQLSLSGLHLSSDSPNGARRLQGKNAEGESCSLEALVTLVTTGGNKFYIVDIRDISSQQQMEKTLYQSRKNQTISALTSGIAHDFNNVLTGVISQLELVLDSAELPVTLRENLEDARISARHGAELVNKLQGFSRPRMMEATTAPPPPVTWMANRLPSKGKEQILVVDDEDLVRKVVRAILAYRGYRITEAVSGAEALQKYFDNPHQYDLIVMDLYMPEMTGREALLRIRRCNPSAKAILLSASLREYENAPELDGIRFLQKPFANEDLVRLVGETLDAGTAAAA